MRGVDFWTGVYVLFLAVLYHKFCCWIRANTRSRVLEKLIFAQLVNKFLSLYGNGMYWMSSRGQKGGGPSAYVPGRCVTSPLHEECYWGPHALADSLDPTEGPVTGSCEHGNEPRFHKRQITFWLAEKLLKNDPGPRSLVRYYPTSLSSVIHTVAVQRVPQRSVGHRCTTATSYRAKAARWWHSWKLQVERDATDTIECILCGRDRGENK
jgi:hypothetical protein